MSPQEAKHGGTHTAIEHTPEIKRPGVQPREAHLTASCSLSSDALAMLASTHLNRFHNTGELQDLEKATEYNSKGLALTPDDHLDLSKWLADLGNCHTYRFRRLGELTPSVHSDTPYRLIGLAASYGDRFQRLGELEDLEKSIDHLLRAFSLAQYSHPYAPNLLVDIGASYTSRFRRLGELEDLEKSISYYNSALALTPSDHPSMSRRLTALSASHGDRFQRLGELEDLEKAIDNLLRALSLTPNNHPDTPSLLSSLGTCYTNRFRRLGELEDLGKSIDYCTRSFASTPSGHPDTPRRLVELSAAQDDRFRRLGELEDLEKAIDNLLRALSLAPDNSPDTLNLLSSLGSCYTNRFRRLGELEDLRKSINYYTRSFTLTPSGHPNMPRRLSELSSSYMDRFHRLGELEDIEKAIDGFLCALPLTPNDHPDTPNLLSNLGNCHMNRFVRLSEAEDFRKSIDYYSRALVLTPDGHPELSTLHFNRALLYFYRYEQTNESFHLKDSLDSFRVASQSSTGAPRDKFRHSLSWANLASRHGALNCLEAYQVTIDLLPQFIWLGTTTDQRYRDLSVAENLAINAAYAAIMSLEFSLALEWLEHARCVVWGQSLMRRSPLDELHSLHSDLAIRLQNISSQLHSATSESHSVRGSRSDSVSPEQAGQERLRLAREYQDLLAQVRQLPGFEDFFRPKKSRNLIRAARDGPVVVINCHKDRCDALLVLPGQSDISHLPLSDFNEDKARLSRSKLETSLRCMRLRERGVKTIRQGPTPKDTIGNVLALLWNDVVKPVLSFLGYMNEVPGNNLPCITWCPTGALTFLPLHAAGDYDQTNSRVFDYAISSYTPTLTALLASTPSLVNRDCRVLAIGQAKTPNHNPLPGTIRELSCMRARLENVAEYSQLIDGQATTTAVLDAMEQHDWVHLACHAHQNVPNPTKSGFYLHDGTLDLATINRRSFTNKGLAFLSACQAATGDEKLPDEAIHLASGMLMAGYPSVIATMWSVVDDDAPFVADMVYAHLLKHEKIGNGEAGKALHYAVAALRDKVGEKKFGRWVPYIHIGS